MPTVIIESKSSHNDIPSYSVQKLISFYTKEAAEKFAKAVNDSNQGSNPDNTVIALVVDATEQAVNGDAPHLLHMLHVNRATRDVEYESVEVFTRRNLEFQKSVGLNPAIIYALENPEHVAPAILTETERTFHHLTEGKQETTDVYLSFLQDIRERIQKLSPPQSGITF
jgi:hypothetical protein